MKYLHTNDHWVCQPEHHDIVEKFAEDFGVELSNGWRCVRRLLGKHCPGFEEYDMRTLTKHRCLPPHADHTTLWLREGKPMAIVTQPYKHLNQRHFREIGEFCDMFGLDFRIEPKAGWWNPGEVVPIVITKKGVGFYCYNQNTTK